MFSLKFYSTLGTFNLRTGRLTKKRVWNAQAALSYATLQAAAGGERNARRLAIVAVANVDAIEPRIRMERSWSRFGKSRSAASTRSDWNVMRIHALIHV